MATSLVVGFGHCGFGYAVTKTEDGNAVTRDIVLGLMHIGIMNRSIFRQMRGNQIALAAALSALRADGVLPPEASGW